MTIFKDVSSNHDLDKLEDELLNDDFEEEDDDSKSLLDSTHDLLKSPDSSKSTTPEQTTPQAKKVSLKRNISIPIPIIDSKIEDETPENSAAEPEKKVVKLAVLTEMERLELRAKKFGGSAAVAASPASVTNVGSKDKLDARAARFGVSVSTPSLTSGPSDEILKKRAERFGAISGEVKKTELNEKLQKRKERFGGGAAEKEAVTSSSPVATSEYAEKARQRLERFKTTA